MRRFPARPEQRPRRSAARTPFDRWVTAAAAAVLGVAVTVVALSGGVGAGGVRVDPAGGDDQAGPPSPTRSHPGGRIAKGTVFAPFTADGFRVDVPEGWQRTERANHATFADRLDLVTVEWAGATAAPTVDSARAVEVPALRARARVFTLRSVGPVSRQAGKGVEIDYLQSGGPDVVTGRTVTDAVERYTFFHAGLRVTLTLAGPKGADNSGSWRAVTDSLHWLR